MKTITLDQIESVLPTLDLLSAIEAGFVAYSSGRAVIPPVGELLLERGEVHIKYGCIKEDPYYVIKVASGFYGNTKLGLPSGNGLMLLFSQRTGELIAILLDEGRLTDVRTAVAGAIAAKYLAPTKVERIGLLGTGVQARLQLRHLEQVVDCRKVLVCGRGQTQLENYLRDLEGRPFEIETTLKADALLGTCNLVVTTTPAVEPLLHEAELQPGTHITAIGSDTEFKQELDPKILNRADLIVSDSVAQSLLRGEISKAIQSADTTHEELIELGDIIAGKRAGRTADEQITVADLTGLAVQDIKIAEAIYRALFPREA